MVGCYHRFSLSVIDVHPSLPSFFHFLLRLPLIWPVNNQMCTWSKLLLVKESIYFAVCLPFNDTPVLSAVQVWWIIVTAIISADQTSIQKSKSNSTYVQQLTTISFWYWITSSQILFCESLFLSLSPLLVLVEANRMGKMVYWDKVLIVWSEQGTGLRRAVTLQKDTRRGENRRTLPHFYNNLRLPTYLPSYALSLCSLAI